MFKYYFLKLANLSNNLSILIFSYLIEIIRKMFLKIVKSLQNCTDKILSEHVFAVKPYQYSFEMNPLTFSRAFFAKFPIFKQYTLENVTNST